MAASDPASESVVSLSPTPEGARDVPIDGDEPRVHAWRALFTAHAAVTGRIERAMTQEDLPPPGWLDVLWALDRAQRGRMRPRELVEHVAISKSGLTRLLDRLVDAGMVERVSCPSDRRGYEIAMTEAGATVLREMWPVYSRELELHFAGISEVEAATLRELLERVGDSACGSEGGF
jgi:DNA-binding MarR family transcriptional regulator